MKKVNYRIGDWKALLLAIALYSLVVFLCVHLGDSKVSEINFFIGCIVCLVINILWYGVTREVKE